MELKDEKRVSEIRIEHLMNEMQKILIAQNELAYTAMQNGDLALSAEAMHHNFDLIMRLWREIVSEMTPMNARRVISEAQLKREIEARATLLELYNKFLPKLQDAMLEYPTLPSDDKHNS